MSWSVTQAIEMLQKIQNDYHENHSKRKEIQEVIDKLSSPDMILVEWSVDDVIECAEQNDLHIGVEDARILLADMAHHHDASLGINWDTIAAYLDNNRTEYNVTSDDDEED